MLSNAFNLILSVHKRSATIERLGGDARVSGLIPQTSLTLTGILTAGVCYILGVRIEKAESNYLFPANSDTYLSLTTIGIFTYQSVPANDPQPTLPAGNLLLAKYTTSATAITSVQSLADIVPVYAVNPVYIVYSPANYSRNLSGPEETTIDGREFVVSKNVLDNALFPSPLKGDRLVDQELGEYVVSEVKQMFDFGGALMGFRLRFS